jgi:hypothetical protein
MRCWMSIGEPLHAPFAAGRMRAKKGWVKSKWRLGNGKQCRQGILRLT